MAGVCRARVLAFGGDVAAASAVLEAASGAVPGTLRAVLVAGTTALVGGNDADPALVRRAPSRKVDRYVAEPVDQLGAGAPAPRGVRGDRPVQLAAAARRVIVAGGDADLARLNVTDRALGLEMLVALAVADGDLDAAESWADRMVPLLASPIGDATAARVMSRVALRPDAWTRPSPGVSVPSSGAREAHRVIEYAEGEIVLNRARLEHSGTSGAEAARALAAMVAELERRGHRMARRAAARELRLAGRRLPPVAGSGWAGLTPREAEVARLVAAGASNADVAGRLHLSAHTVHAHGPGCSRRSPSRPARRSPARWPTPQPHPAGPAPGPRSPSVSSRWRRWSPAACRTPASPSELGVSSRTVERHVSDILQRWRLASRTALAQAWLEVLAGSGGQAAEQGALVLGVRVRRQDDRHHPDDVLVRAVAVVARVVAPAEGQHAGVVGGGGRIGEDEELGALAWCRRCSRSSR